MTTKNQQQKQEEAEKSYDIDLTSLPVAALKKLQKQINNLLREAYIEELDPKDVVLEYDIKLHASNGRVYENKGVTKMNRITSPRLIVDAPRRFEAEFLHQVYEPVYADAMELFDQESGSNKSLLTLKQTIGKFDEQPIPGLPAPGGGI